MWLSSPSSLDVWNVDLLNSSWVGFPALVSVCLMHRWSERVFWCLLVALCWWQVANILRHFFEGKRNSFWRKGAWDATCCRAYADSFASCAFACVRAKSLQSCLTLCNPMGCSPPGFPVHGIFQARVLECIAIPISRSSRPRDRNCVAYISCIGSQALGHQCHLGSLGITGVLALGGCLLQAELLNAVSLTC